MMTITCGIDELRVLGNRILRDVGTLPEIAQDVTEALLAAELDDIPSHGLSRLPIYADQVKVGKVDGKAKPVIERPRLGIVVVDAGHGFAFPAIHAGAGAATDAARESGVAVLAVRNSHHCGVAGHHVEEMARRGLISLMFANTPSAIAPWGGSQGLFGTNPIAFAIPRRAHRPLVIDLSMGKVARGKILIAARRGERIPADWALDRTGQPTTDPQAALDGALLPFGDAKGAALALMVELLAAAVTGSHFGFEASSFLDDRGHPPDVGQLFIVIDPGPFDSRGVADRVESMCAAIASQPGARLPGDRRIAARNRAAKIGIAIPEALLEELRRRVATSTGS